MATSTPNEHISSLAEKYGIPLYINTGKSGIAGDWNFAASCAQTKLVTIAHQDDVYKDNFSDVMLREMNRCSNPVLFTSNYAELRNGKEVRSNVLLNIKKILRIPIRINNRSYFSKKLTLCFGDPYMCPTFTFVKDILMQDPFEDRFRASVDWQQWEKMSHIPGEFAYSNEYIFLHRIHPGSETSNCLNEHVRIKEDYEMFKMFWPTPIAKILTKAYSLSEKSNISK